MDVSPEQVVRLPKKAPTSPFDRRKMLLLTLIGVILVFISVVLFRFYQLNRVLDESHRAMESLMESQRNLANKLDEVESSGLVDRLALEERLKQMIEGKDRPVGSTVKIGVPPPLETAMRSVVEVVCIDNMNKDTYYTASGTSVDKTGLIVTNRHILVSDDGSLINYCGVGFTTDMSEPPAVDYISTTVAIHEKTDLAILKITERIDKQPLPSDFPFVTVAGSTKIVASLNLGDQIYVGGYPDIGADTFTFTEGVVSGRVGDDFIKTSALIDSGASGGGGFDAMGRYIGVPTAAAKGEIGGSLGYLIGADIVEKFLSEYDK